MLTQEREAQVRQLLLVWLKSMVQVLRCECVEPDLLCASLQADAHGLLKLFAPVFEVDGSVQWPQPRNAPEKNSWLSSLHVPSDP